MFSQGPGYCMMLHALSMEGEALTYFGVKNVRKIGREGGTGSGES